MSEAMDISTLRLVLVRTLRVLTGRVDAATAAHFAPKLDIAVTSARSGQVIATSLAVAALASVFATWHHPWVVSLWGASIVLLQCALYAAQRRFRRSRTTAETLTARTRIFASLSCLHAVLLAACGPLFWVDGDVLNNALILVVLAASVATSVAETAAYPPVFAVNSSPYAVSLVLTPLQYGGDALPLALTGIAALYVLLMAIQAGSQYALVERVLALGEDNAGLVSELKRAKTEADRARDRAETASAAKSSFLAHMSHELRTPLNAIIGFSDVIHSRLLGVDHEKYTEYAGYIRSSGQHLLSLINDVLDLSKIEAGRYELSEGRIDLGALVRESTELMSLRSTEAGVTLVADVAPDLPKIRGDERALRQVLLNLLTNAVKFTPQGGRITVTARRPASGAIVLAVADTGAGIPAADQAHIFEPFRQARHDVAMPEKGTGLGLAIVKGLVAAHGGDVVLESAVGRGTTVTVRLPASRALSSAA